MPYFNYLQLNKRLNEFCWMLLMKQRKKKKKFCCKDEKSYFGRKLSRNGN